MAHKIPSVVRNMRWIRRFVYIVINIFMMLWIFSVHGGVLVSKTGTINQDAAWPLYIFVGISWITYFLIQGSDPGYVSPIAVYEQNGEWSSHEARIPHVAQSTSHHTLHENDETYPSAHDVDIDMTSCNVASNDSPSNMSRSKHARTRHEEFEDVTLSDSEFDSHTVPIDFLEDTFEEQQTSARKCIWCLQLQPLRAHHCRVCDRCVHSFSHHCGFLGTCIGEKNVCRFWWYIATQTIPLAIALGYIHTTFGSTSQLGSAIVLCIILWIATLSTGGLAALHLWLAASNTTGYEQRHRPEDIRYFRGLGIEHPELDMPFSQGLITNLRNFCCVRDSCWTALYGKRWKPQVWKAPDPATLSQSDASADCLENPWRNKYWTCC